MLSNREQSPQEILVLPSADQAFLAQSLGDHLIAQADPEAEESTGLAEGQLLLELQRRSAAYRSGQITWQAAADVLNGLRQRQACEKAN